MAWIRQNINLNLDCLYIKGYCLNYCSKHDSRPKQSHYFPPQATPGTVSCLSQVFLTGSLAFFCLSVLPMVCSLGTESIGQLFAIPPLGTVDYVNAHKLNIPRTILSIEASWNRASHIHAIALFPPPTRVTSSKLSNRTSSWPVVTPNCAKLIVWDSHSWSRARTAPESF